MPFTKLRKKAIYFVITAGILILVLLVLPGNDWLRHNIASSLGLTYVDQTDSLTNPAGEPVSTMTETTFSLLYNIIKLVKIAVWMALVISIIRFIGYVVAATTSRKSATQSEIVTLLRTIVS